MLRNLSSIWHCRNCTDILKVKSYGRSLVQRGTGGHRRSGREKNRGNDVIIFELSKKSNTVISFCDYSS